MKHLTFSEVKRAHSLLRYLWPVQSWGQAGFMAAVYALGLPVLAFALHRQDAREPTWGTMLAAALSATGGLYLRLPATFEVTTSGDARHLVAEVSYLLSLYGYERCGRLLHFAGRWPRWLPDWLRWTETEIDLSVHDQRIVLHGPKSVLRVLRRRWDLDAVGPHHA